jgi:hypothetical protein
MPDLRSNIQKKLDDTFGMPLYYCSECLRAVKVTARGEEPLIERPCTDCKDAQIFAPRKAIAVGKGGASIRTKVDIFWMKLAAALTGRCS